LSRGGGDLARRSEEVTARAAGRVGEVLLAIGMTAQAAFFSRAGRFAVAGMAAVAGGVLRHAMQPRQLCGLVTAGAGGGGGDACRSMRSVAIRASCAHLTMGRARGLCVARCTGLGGGAGMGFVTIATSLMAGDGRALLGLVTGAAIRSDTSAVGLVARAALGVPLVGVSALRSVTRAAAGDPQLRAMGQPLMTALARLVPWPGPYRG
jgi:hypothetical protein